MNTTIADKLVFIHSNLRLLSRSTDGYKHGAHAKWDIDPEDSSILDSRLCKKVIIVTVIYIYIYIYIYELIIIGIPSLSVIYTYIIYYVRVIAGFNYAPFPNCVPKLLGTRSTHQMNVD
jgi:hypothetical protein